LLKLADAYKARLTFFVVGSRVQQLPHVVEQQAASGHQIGNHSWSHRSFAGLDDDAVCSEIAATQAAISACNAKCSAVRPPYGAVSSHQRSLIEREFGLSVELWTVDSRDWEIRSPKHIRDAVLAAAVDGAVVLAHDIHATTIEAMEAILPELSASGFEFVTLSDLGRQ
jgi:peptidoglycan/xylan/chitin deacetylase (PgdA/CDA1 family)